MDGQCDVKDCRRVTYMGWQPLTESRGRQVCEYHWTRHKDPQDSFDLFDAFGFRRPTKAPKPKPAAEPIPEIALRKSSERISKPIAEQGPGLHCKACGAEREAGHTYCPKCAVERKKRSDRERQKRRYQKMQKPHAFAPKLSQPVCDSLQGEIVAWRKRGACSCVS